jgi:uncharacterized protein (TIGR03086 family)
MMSEISERYRRRADTFESKVAAVQPGRWDSRSPCADWRAIDVVRHVVEMHAAMLRPVDRQLSPAPPIDDDPLTAYRSARIDVQAVLDDPELAGVVAATPGGPMTVAEHIDRVISEDLVLHGWDLARATGQDDAIDPIDLDRMWAGLQAVPPEVMKMMRTPDAFGPGIVVFGPEVPVPEDAPIQDRLLGMIGRDPARH